MSLEMGHRFKKGGGTVALTATVPPPLLPSNHRIYGSLHMLILLIEDRHQKGHKQRGGTCQEGKPNWGHPPCEGASYHGKP